MDDLLRVAFPPRRNCEKCGCELPKGRISVVCRVCVGAEKNGFPTRDIEAVNQKNSERRLSVESWRPPNRYTCATFESFERKLQPPAYTIACKIDSDSRGLLMTGPPGVGKTHLAAAIFNRHYTVWEPAIVRQPTARFVRENDLFMRLRASFRPQATENEETILKDYQRCQILILDDLCKYEPADSKFRNRIYYELFDSIYNDGHTVLVVTANQSVSELVATLGPAIVDRLRDMCQVVEMSGVSQRGKQ